MLAPLFLLIVVPSLCVTFEFTSLALNAGGNLKLQAKNSEINRDASGVFLWFSDYLQFVRYFDENSKEKLVADCYQELLDHPFNVAIHTGNGGCVRKLTFCKFAVDGLFLKMFFYSVERNSVAKKLFLANSVLTILYCFSFIVFFSFFLIMFVRS